MDSRDGADANPGISPSTPWKTLAAVHGRTFRPGDSIYFKRGSSWAGGLVIDDSGLPGLPITFTTYGTGPPPIFQNPGVPQGSAVTIAADWVVVEGFLVRDAHQGGIQIAEGANHNVVRRCEATKVGIGVSVRGRFNLITHNFLHDLAMVENTPGGDDDYGAVGVWLFAPDNEVSYNRSVNCRAPSYDYGADGGAVEIYRNGDNSSIHHNWGEANNGFMEVGGGTARNVRLAYNVSVNNGGAFLVIHLGGRFAATLQNFRAENNTIVELSEAHQMIDWVGGTPTPDMLFYRNNLMYTATTVSSSGNFTRDHNLFCLIEGTRLGFLLGTNEQTADPRFVNLEGRDFHVQAGSPAIDAGTELGHASDFDGRTVPQGRAPDVGAYEFSGAAPNDYCP